MKEQNLNSYVKFEKIKNFIDTKGDGHNIFKGENQPVDKQDFFLNWLNNADLSTTIFFDLLESSSAFDFNQNQKNKDIKLLLDGLSEQNNTALNSLLMRSYEAWLINKNVSICINVNKHTEIFKETALTKELEIENYIIDMITNSLKEGRVGWKSFCQALNLTPMSALTGKPYSGMNAMFLSLILKVENKIDENGNLVFKVDINGNKIPQKLKSGDFAKDLEGNILYEIEKKFVSYEDNRWTTKKFAEKTYGGLSKNAIPRDISLPEFKQSVIFVDENKKVKIYIPTTKNYSYEQKVKKIDIQRFHEYQAKKIVNELIDNFPDKSMKIKQQLNSYLKSDTLIFKNFLSKIEMIGINCHPQSEIIGSVIHNVYNIQETNNPPPIQKPNVVLNIDKNINEQVEQLKQNFSKSTGISISETNNGQNYFSYNKNSGSIFVTKKELFKNNDYYYSTLLHEISHATGWFYKNMITSNNKYDSRYAKEEMIAEISAVLLCARLGVNYNLENHVSYISGFSKNVFNNIDSFKKTKIETDAWSDGFKKL